MLQAKYMQLAKAFIQERAPIPEPAIEDFLAEGEVKIYPKRSLFTQIGDGHDRVALVIQGLFKVYYLSPDGEIHIRNFCNEGTVIGSYGTILLNEPAHVNIEAVEDSTVFEFSFRSLSKRYEQELLWERLGRRVAESHYISRERREYYFLMLDAAERLARFRQDFPNLEERLSRTNLASYIGVRPETLSRLVKTAD